MNKSPSTPILLNITYLLASHSRVGADLRAIVIQIKIAHKIMFKNMYIYISILTVNPIADGLQDKHYLIQSITFHCGFNFYIVCGGDDASTSPTL